MPQVVVLLYTFALCLSFRPRGSLKYYMATLGWTRIHSSKQKTGKKDNLYVVSQLPTGQYSVLEEIHMKIHIEGL